MKLSQIIETMTLFAHSLDRTSAAQRDVSDLKRFERAATEMQDHLLRFPTPTDRLAEARKAADAAIAEIGAAAKAAQVHPFAELQRAAAEQNKLILALEESGLAAFKDRFAEIVLDSAPASQNAERIKRELDRLGVPYDAD